MLSMSAPNPYPMPPFYPTQQYPVVSMPASSTGKATAAVVSFATALVIGVVGHTFSLLSFSLVQRLDIATFSIVNTGISLFTALLGVIAVVTGIVALSRHSRPALAGAGVALGGSAVLSTGLLLIPYLIVRLG